MSQPTATGTDENAPAVGGSRAAWTAFAIVAVCLLAVFAGSAVVPGRIVHDAIDTNDVTFVGTVYEQWAARVREGTVPLWFGEDACGTPMAAAWMYGMLYPGLALFAILPFGFAWAWTAILHIAFGAAGMASFVSRRGVSTMGAVSGAVLFGVSEFMVGRAACGHLNILLPLCFAPWVMRFADDCVRGGSVPEMRRAVALLGLSLGVGLLAGHVQIWCYVAPLLVALCLRELWVSIERRAVMLRLAAGVGLAAGIAAPQILLTLAYLREAQAVVPDLAVITAVSVPPAELLPKLLTGWTPWIDMADYDFRHEFRGIAGLGAVAAAAYGVVVGARRRWFWVTVLAVGVLLSFGEHLRIASYLNNLPPLSLTRAPGRGLVLVLISVSVLAAYGADRVAARISESSRIFVPLGAAALALCLGIPWPMAISDATHKMDWFARLPDEVRRHRVHAPGLYQLSNVEGSGLSTLRPSVYIQHRGFADLVFEKSAAVAWWLDVSAQVSPEWSREPSRAEPIPPPDSLLSVSIDRMAAMGPARLFGAATFTAGPPVLTDASVLTRLRAGERTLFIDGSRPSDAGSDTEFDSGGASVVQVPGTKDEVRLAVQAPQAAWLFVSMRIDSGWRAEVDGKDVEILRGNLAFPVVRVPQGAHEVRFVYRPLAFRIGLISSFISLAAAALLLLRRRR